MRIYSTIVFFSLPFIPLIFVKFSQFLLQFNDWIVHVNSMTWVATLLQRECLWNSITDSQVRKSKNCHNLEKFIYSVDNFFFFYIYIYIYIIFHVSLSDRIWQKGFVQEVTCTSQETFCFWYFQMLLAHHKGSLGEMSVECKWKELSE